MINAQEWLNNNYFNKEKVEIIVLNDLNIEQKSELTINDFPNLIEIKRSDEDVNYKKDIYKITKLIITNCPSLEKVNINGFRDNEELVLSEVPNLIELRCRFNQLTNLDLSQCNNLQVLNCGKNKLTNLDLSNCSNLTGIYCYDNLLAKLDFLLHLNPQKLEGLGLESNNFTKQNLTFFRRFTNLQYLYLGNENKWKIKQNIYNRFYGSMESLWYLTKLELLSINGTDINRGWEYLPRKLVAIKCDEYNGRKIYKQLKNYPCLSEDITGYYNFPSWKLANKEKNCELIRQKIAKVRHQKFQAQIQILPKQN